MREEAALFFKAQFCVHVCMHACMHVCMHVCDWSADYMNQLNSLTEHMNHWFVGCAQNRHSRTYRLTRSW